MDKPHAIVDGSEEILALVREFDATTLAPEELLTQVRFGTAPAR